MRNLPPFYRKGRWFEAVWVPADDRNRDKVTVADLERLVEDIERYELDMQLAAQEKGHA